MQHSLSQNESKPRGTANFPIERYHVDCRDPRFQMAYHWHLEFEIIRIVSGNFALTRDEQEYALRAGDLVFLSSGALHGGTPSPDCVYECLVFDPGMLLRKDVAGQAEFQRMTDGEWSVPPLPRAEAPAVWNAVDALFSALAAPAPGTPLIVQGLLLQCFGLLLNSGRCHAAPAPRVNRKTAQIKRVLARIEADYAEDLTLAELAAEAGMSAKYFCHFFQQLTHRTPIDYLNAYRIEQACCLLLSGAHSVTDAAYCCGFNDLSYFIRIFRRYKGTSPGAYARAARKAALVNPPHEKNLEKRVDK